METETKNLQVKIGREKINIYNAVNKIEWVETEISFRGYLGAYYFGEIPKDQIGIDSVFETLEKAQVDFTTKALQNLKTKSDNINAIFDILAGYRYDIPDFLKQ